MALHKLREPEGLDILRDLSLSRWGSVREHTAAVAAYAQQSRLPFDQVRALIAVDVPRAWRAAGRQEIEDIRISRVYALGEGTAEHDAAIARHAAIRARLDAAGVA